jgi:hypothetical protein
MCGRYRLSRRKQIIEQHFDTISGDEDWVPRYNVAPTQPVPIIRQHPKKPRRDLSLVRLGLIPPWAKDASGSAGMINARSESASTKPAFRDALSCAAAWFLRMGSTSGCAPERRNSHTASKLTRASCSPSPDFGSVGKIRVATGLSHARF